MAPIRVSPQYLPIFPTRSLTRDTITSDPSTIGTSPSPFAVRRTGAADRRPFSPGSRRMAPRGYLTRNAARLSNAADVFSRRRSAARRGSTHRRCRRGEGDARDGPVRGNRRRRHGTRAHSQPRTPRRGDGRGGGGPVRAVANRPPCASPGQTPSPVRTTASCSPTPRSTRSSSRPRTTRTAVVLEDALATDKAILVEKPLCTTVEDCRRMEAAARRGGEPRLGGDGVPVHAGRSRASSRRCARAPSGGCACSTSANTAGRSSPRSATGTGSPATPAAPWSRSAATSSISCGSSPATSPCGSTPPAPRTSTTSTNAIAARFPDLIDNAFVIVDFAGGGRGPSSTFACSGGVAAEQEIVATGDAGRAACTIPRPN